MRYLLFLSIFIFFQSVLSEQVSYKGDMEEFDVVSVTPLHSTISYPIEECWVEEVEKGRFTPEELLGGVLGGVLGSQIGSGSGKQAATATGTLLGSELLDEDEELTGEELVGGILGGAIGAQIGKGNGNTAAIVAGTLVGQIVGEHLDDDGRALQVVRSCREVILEKKVTAKYVVKYKGHDGVVRRTVLDYDPTKGE